MILRALKELAEREGLVAHPDFDPCEVRYLVTIGPDGRVHGDIQDTLDVPVRASKGRARAAVKQVPKRSKRTTQDQAEFLVDKAEYVFGWGEKQERARKRHGLYVEEVKQAFAATGDEALRALLRLLESLARQEATIPRPADWQEGDLIGFQYSSDPDGPRLISSREEVVRYWARRRRELEAAATRRTGKPGSKTAKEGLGGETQCLVTGKVGEPVRLHPKIKGIPPVAETKGGVPLTSINAEAFDSYELSALGCAPVSPEAADAYEKGLNRLLAAAYPSPGDGTPLPRRNFRLSDATVVVFWSRNDSPVIDLFAESVHHADPEAVAALYSSTWKGRPIKLDDPSEFYALTLSGGQGRATIRGWFESTVRDVIQNVRGHFDDLKIVAVGGGQVQSFPLWQLLRRTAVQGKPENVHPNLAATAFDSVLKGWLYPRMLLEAALRRARAERSVCSYRAALIKAYLVRARRLGRLPSDFPEVKPMLDRDCTTPAYRLGRLFAVLEKVQADATNASTTIRERFYGAASATPVVVFGQLLRKAPHHLAKLDHATFYEKLIQEIMCALQPPRPFPTSLTLEEQGLFAVGYYHQRQALFTKRSDNRGVDASNADADGAATLSEGE